MSHYLTHEATSIENRTFLLEQFFALLPKCASCAIIRVSSRGVVESLHGDVEMLGAEFPGIAVGVDLQVALRAGSEHLAAVEQALGGISCEVPGELFHTRVSPLFGKNGAIDSIVCLLTASSKRQALSLVSAREGVFFVDRNYVMYNPNKAVGEYLGAELKSLQLEGQVCHKAFFGFSSPCLSCPAAEVFRTGKPARGSYYDAKRQRFLSLSAVPVFNPENGELEGAIETFRDVSSLLEDTQTASEHEHAILMLDALPISCGLFNRELKMIACNHATVNFFQCAGKIETCERVFEMFPEKQPDGRVSAEAALLELNQTFENGYNRVEWTFLLPDGTLVPAEVTIVKLSCGGEDMLATYTRDLREEKALRAATDEANERIRLMFDATPLCCSLWDEEYNNIACNLEAVKLFDLSSKQEYLKHFSKLSPEKQPDGESSAVKMRCFIRQAFETGYQRFEWMHQKLNGEPVPAEVTLVRIKRGDHYIVAGYTRDLREEKSLYRAKETAMRESQKDPLTRLYNKHTAKFMIDKVLARSEAGSVHALLCIDLDNFKSTNDDFGHLFGDDVLVEIAGKIKRMFRSSDICGRFGGDEFILFVNDLPSLDFVKEKAKALCAQIKRKYSLGSVSHTVSASIGVAIYPADGTTYYELYQNADAASYHVKRSGKNGYAFWGDCEGEHRECVCKGNFKNKSLER